MSKRNSIDSSHVKAAPSLTVAMGALTLFVALTLSCDPASAQTPGKPTDADTNASAGPGQANKGPLTADQQSELTFLMNIIKDTALEPERRRNAVKFLLARDWSQATSALVEMLEPTTDPSTLGVITQALAGMRLTPAEPSPWRDSA